MFQIVDVSRNAMHTWNAVTLHCHLDYLSKNLVRQGHHCVRFWHKECPNCMVIVLKIISLCNTSIRHWASALGSLSNAEGLP